MGLPAGSARKPYSPISRVKLFGLRHAHPVSEARPPGVCAEKQSLPGPGQAGRELGAGAGARHSPHTESG